MKTLVAKLDYLKVANFFILIILLSLAGCADKSKWANRIEWAELSLFELPDEQDFPDEGAVVLYDEGKMEIFSSGPTGFSEFERHKIIKILNVRGEKYANIMIPFFPGVSIDDIQARTISSSGIISVLEENKIYDVNLYPNFVFYSDQRAKIFTMPAIAPGSLIEYRYKVSIRGRTLWHSWTFQDNIPTLLSRYTLIHPSEWKLNYKLYNLDIAPDEEIAPVGFKATRTWEARNLPALKSEFGMPSRKHAVAKLTFAPNGVKTWNDVAVWYNNLASPQTEPNQDMKELAERLTYGLLSDEEKLRTIYEWVRDNVRYIAVEIGLGGYQPYPASEVFTNRYGDCKDMTTLLCGLAEASDIQVDEVLISTWQNGVVDTTLPSPFQFNHAIAYCPTIGENGIWMDATDKGCTFGKLPWYDQGLPALVIGKGGEASLKITYRDSASSNHSRMNWKVNLNSDGSAIVQGKTQLWGVMASEMRADLLFSSQEEIRQWLEMHIAKRSIGTTLDSFKVNGLREIKDPLEISFNFHSTGFARKRSNQLILQPGTVSLFELPKLFRSRPRSYPIQFRFPFVQELKMEVQIPDSYQVAVSTFDDSLNTDFGSATWTCSSSQNILQLHVTYMLSKSHIAQDRYQDFLEFLRELQLKDQWEIMLLPQNFDREAD